MGNGAAETPLREEAPKQRRTQTDEPYSSDGTVSGSCRITTQSRFGEFCLEIAVSQRRIPKSNTCTLKWVTKSQWSRGHLQCSLPSPAVAFQQLTASFEHQSLSPLVLCMKYYDFDSITLFVPVCALASLGFYNGVSFQKQVKLQEWE